MTKDPSSAPGGTGESGEGDRLPFEPKSNRKKDTPKDSKASSPKDSAGASKTKGTTTLEETRIPDVVSQRMLRRIAVFSGIPTGLGISSFVVSYLVVSQEIFDLPNSVVVVGSLMLFGLGTLGLSYGVLSASWEEDQPGSLLGWGEFQVNVRRFIQSWKEFRQKSRQK
jgi:hypothetical protein